MNYEVRLNAYEKNQVTLYAVQGEKDSRTIVCTLIEKSGIQIAVSNATIVDKKLDLTDYMAAMYVIRSDNVVVSCTGEIVGATDGTVQFTLPEQCTDIAGTAQCAVVLTKPSGEDLRIVGLTLQVAALDTEVKGAVTIDIPCGTSKTIFVAVTQDSGDAYELKNGDKLIFGVKRRVSDKDYLIEKTVTTDYKTNDGYAISIIPEDTAEMSGTYLYEIGLQTAEGDYYIVVESSPFEVSDTLTRKE